MAFRLSARPSRTYPRCLLGFPQLSSAVLVHRFAEANEINPRKMYVLAVGHSSEQNMYAQVRLEQVTGLFLTRWLQWVMTLLMVMRSPFDVETTFDGRTGSYREYTARLQR